MAKDAYTNKGNTINLVIHINSNIGMNVITTVTIKVAL